MLHMFRVLLLLGIIIVVLKSCRNWIEASTYLFYFIFAHFLSENMVFLSVFDVDECREPVQCAVFFGCCCFNSFSSVFGRRNRY